MAVSVSAFTITAAASVAAALAAIATVAAIRAGTPAAVVLRAGGLLGIPRMALFFEQDGLAARADAVTGDFDDLDHHFVAELGDIRQLHFTLEINGEVRQRGYTGDMIFGVDELLSHVSRYITYRTGDLFFTGTPAGAGPVERGDVLRATLEGRELLNFEIR